MPKSYEEHIKLNEVIAHHHIKHPNDRYAPAWKTLEYMTFGDVLKLAMSLKNSELQMKLAKHFGLKKPYILWNWMNHVRVLRNLCAHGHNLYDVKFRTGIIGGPLHEMMKDDEMYHDLRGLLLVVFYLLRQISQKREKELKDELKIKLQTEEAKSVNGVMLYLNDVLE